MKSKSIEHVEIQEDEVEINEQVLTSTETGAMKGYRNIALFGVDSRDQELDKNTRTEWERLEDKKGMTYKEFWEMWRQKTIQEYKNKLTALDIAQPPAVIKIKKKKTSN